MNGSLESCSLVDLVVLCPMACFLSCATVLITGCGRVVS